MVAAVGVVASEKLAPPPIADPGDGVRRVDDVRDEHGRQEAPGVTALRANPRNRRAAGETARLAHLDVDPTHSDGRAQRRRARRRSALSMRDGGLGGSRSSRSTCWACFVAMVGSTGVDEPGSSRQAAAARLQEAYSTLRRLGLCARKQGLASVGVIAVDGTKLPGNASRNANVDYEQLAREILEEAQAVDAAEDEVYGNARGDELPEQLRTGEGRRRVVARGQAPARRAARGAGAAGAAQPRQAPEGSQAAPG